MHLEMIRGLEMILPWTTIPNESSKASSLSLLFNDFGNVRGSLIPQLVKNLACNAGDPSLIPGLGRSTGKRIGYPLQYSWTFLVPQMVKNPCAMQETWVQSLCWGHPLEEGMATHSSILAWRIPVDRGAWWATVHGVTKSQTQLSD